MTKFIYANETVFEGNIIDENEHGYTIEYLDESAVKGFTDTVFLERELTVIVENRNNEMVTIADSRREGVSYTGKLMKGNLYNYIVFQHEMSENTIVVKKLKKTENGQTSVYYWDVKKDTLKGSGGLPKSVLKLVKELI